MFIMFHVYCVLSCCQKRNECNQGCSSSNESEFIFDVASAVLCFVEEGLEAPNAQLDGDAWAHSCSHDRFGGEPRSLFVA
jgi:hypothetical protein